MKATIEEGSVYKNIDTQPIPFSLSDCQLAFDNDQVVGKSWQITSTHNECFVDKKKKEK